MRNTKLDFFRSLCVEAAGGRENGYFEAGGALMERLAELLGEEPVNYLSELDELFRKGTEEEVLGWFERTFPQCLELVPLSRRGELLRGIYEAGENMFGVLWTGPYDPTDPTWIKAEEMTRRQQEAAEGKTPTKGLLWLRCKNPGCGEQVPVPKSWNWANGVKAKCDAMPPHESLFTAAEIKEARERGEAGSKV